jgi:hypothetical protein
MNSQEETSFHLAEYPQHRLKHKIPDNVWLLPNPSLINLVQAPTSP